jgi:hypothetical protein
VSALQLLEMERKRRVSALQLLEMERKRWVSALQLLEMERKRWVSALQLLEMERKRRVPTSELLECPFRAATCNILPNEMATRPIRHREKFKTPLAKPRNLSYSAATSLHISHV